MKKIIKKWLGVSELEDVLTDDNFPKVYIGNELDSKLEEKEFKQYKERLSELYAECFTCGSYCRKTKMKPLPVLEKDLPSESSDSWSYTGTNMWFNALYASDCLFTTEASGTEKSKTVYFCQHCPIIYPKKKKNAKT